MPPSLFLGCVQQICEAQRRCERTEALLQESEVALRSLRCADQRNAAGNLAYLKQVIERYIRMDDGEDSDALFQVIATFLQFDATTVEDLQRARQRKAAAQRSILGRASLLF